MITVYINGREEKTSKDQMLAEFLLSLQHTAPRFSVAVNEVFIPKSDYGSICINAGDRVELLVPMQGG